MLKKLTNSSPSQTTFQPQRPSALDSRYGSQAQSQAQAQPAAEPAAAAAEEPGSRLIVGPNIKLKGSEILDCDVLVVEGRVEVSMNSRVIHIKEGGVFAGKAEIDVAEVHGRFEGELTARKHLVVHSTGRVTGKIHYGSLKVEEGAVLSGSIENLSATNKPALAEVRSEDKPKDAKDAPTTEKSATTNPSWLAAAR